MNQRIPESAAVVKSPFVRTVSIVLASGLAALLAGCPQPSPEEWHAVAAKDPAKYRAMVTAFYTGDMALRVNDPDRARTSLLAASKLYPDEPATWADLAVLDLRARQLDQAGKELEKARSVAPNDSGVLLIAAQLEDARGNLEGSVADARKVLRKEPGNMHAHALLVQQLERQSSASDAETRAEYEKISEVDPHNLAALLELARLAAKAGDRTSFLGRLKGLAQNSGTWPEDPQARLSALLKKAETGDPKSCATDVQKLANVLMATPEYRSGAAVLGRGSSAEVGTPIDRFLKLPLPTATPAPPDTSLSFAAKPFGAGKAAWAMAMELEPAPPPAGTAASASAAAASSTPAGSGAAGSGAAPTDASATPVDTGAPPPTAAPDPPPNLVYASDGDLLLDADGKTRLPVPGGANKLSFAREVLAVDWNDDYRPDLVLAGAGGLRFFQQTEGSKWTDVTAATKLPSDLLSSSFQGAWALDFDLDGDLDVLVAPNGKEVVGLQNDGDGTWKRTVPFPGVIGLRDFVWADLNGDGVPDAALIDGSGRLLVFLNQRGGHFQRADLGLAGGMALAISVADVNRDGIMALTVLRPGGAIDAVAHTSDGAWKSKILAQWAGAPAATGTAPATLLWGDLDNNGAVDLVASGSKGTQVWLGTADGSLQALPLQLDARVSSLTDVDGDGRLDLVGVTKEGRPVVLLNHGSLNYGWQVLRPRDAHVREGDEKINAFGVGGEAEARAGLLVQKLPITGPQVHFGLGSYSKADVVRIIWPNGQSQAEFNLPTNSEPLAMQRLLSSCPWLFADDGHGMKFVTDLLWKSPLGLRINAQNTAGVSQTRDWVKIRGDQLQPQNGFYNVRVTAELWETDFFDLTSLMVVDHPAGTELVLDERFAIPQPELKLHLAQVPMPIARATDQNGRDVTDLVAARDDRYLDTFPLGRYQGVARDHFVELEIPEMAPRQGPLWLLGNGWVFPTDSSINVAISQGRQEKPRGLSLEVPDGHGGWRVARQGLGFPAGKYKTVLLDLTGLFPAGSTGPRRLRLRTNMEIYWDAFSVAAPAETARGALRTQFLTPESADLRYRGFSTLQQEKRSTPETPQYELLAGTSPQWLDLEGYYTRFGDVRELLKKADDRYVIMNAGDELALRFRAPAPPPTGWTRDFVFVSDGWDKDGNFNTSWSQTVLPLPSHRRPAYDRAPGRLQDDPVVRSHPDDWATYQTRYVNSRAFLNLLRQ